MTLVAQDLTVRFPGLDRPAVNGVSLEVRPGELLAMGGPNGSGKTTMLRALLGVIQPARGEVLLEGRPIREWDRKEVARRIGVVAQREESWLPLTVLEVVQMGRYPHLGPLSPLQRVDHLAVERALERTDLTEFIGRTVDTLSGGEWQRVRIARALAQEPMTLVLDEPSSALDVRHEMEVMELIRALVDDGIACLMISHHLNLSARYADRMVLMHKGGLAAMGSPGDVMTEPVLSQVFNWPVAISTGPEGAPRMTPLRPGQGR
jgi:iron complex transport system ATP-binding protein